MNIQRNNLSEKDEDEEVDLKDSLNPSFAKGEQEISKGGSRPTTGVKINRGGKQDYEEDYNQQ
jgi:hypothetical protein